MKGSSQSVFEHVCDLSASDREQQLDKLCQGDDVLRSEVQSLLHAYDHADQFLNEPTLDSGPDLSGRAAQPGKAANLSGIQETIGTTIDRYKLLEKIGEGGFGVVYMAGQSEPIRRRVALKIIKPGMDTKQVVGRFEAERQALAMMDHPNIARVIDGGATDTGRPFFVMELVRGDPITNFCDQRKMALRERLELFHQVCRAIEHAHQKGITHRDIKPNNVLVTIADDKPLVKVIDFGIAKATNRELTDKTVFTEFRQLIGTPQYMSPEQAEKSGVDIDTRTDVYSLGVLLYEMLTGRTPLDPKKLNSAAWGELQRMIVEDEPSKPSVMALSAIGDLDDQAKKSRIDRSLFAPELRGDLDWIVLKAIDKDRSRRYGTASQFADDIERYLRDEVVEATPPSTRYQLRKFARRHRSLLATVATVFVALVFGVIATAVTASWALDERRVAQQQAKSAKRAALMLPESEAKTLADDWKREIDELKSRVGESDRQAAMLQTQYANWYATWLLRHGKADEAKQLIDDCYQASKKLVGPGEPSFLALCNSRILVAQAIEDDPKRIAASYDDLVESLNAIHGEVKSIQLYPEYAGALLAAGRDEDAAEKIKVYLATKIEAGELSAVENIRLDFALDKLATWKETRPELFAGLQSVRDSGTTLAGMDDQLRADLENFQGKWEHKRWEKGKIVEHMFFEANGNESISTWVDEAGETVRARRGRFQLSRDGSVKLMTVQLGAEQGSGGKMIYKMKKDQFIVATGMLTNQESLPETRMRYWNRVKQD